MQNSSDGGDVKTALESESQKPAMLIVSGGEGYVDFRIGSNSTGLAAFVNQFYANRWLRMSIVAY